MISQQKRCLLAIVALCFLGGQVMTAQAAMVSTWSLMEEQQLGTEQEQLKGYLAQEEVKDKLLALGADPEQLQQRVDNLTLAELQQLNQQIEELPAGSGVIGAIVLIFVVFIITDALGATDIFPFVNPIN